jgi:hypothetical protein
MGRAEPRQGRQDRPRRPPEVVRMGRRRRQAIEIRADSIVPISTLHDAWEPHDDHDDNVNPVGDEDIPI